MPLTHTHARASPVPQIIRTVSPVVAASLGEELAHWTQTIIETTLTFIAVIFAWWLQVREPCLSLSPPLRLTPKPLGLTSR